MYCKYEDAFLRSCATACTSADDRSTSSLSLSGSSVSGSESSSTWREVTGSARVDAAFPERTQRRGVGLPTGFERCVQVEGPLNIPARDGQVQFDSQMDVEVYAAAAAAGKKKLSWLRRRRPSPEAAPARAPGAFRLRADVKAACADLAAHWGGDADWAGLCDALCAETTSWVLLHDALATFVPDASAREGVPVLALFRHLGCCGCPQECLLALARTAVTYSDDLEEC